MGLFKFCITYHPDSKNGGGERARTVDPLRARQVLSQLSYTPHEISFNFRNYFLVNSAENIGGPR